MKALTLWQPWASLIMIGAKPYEFRGWDYRRRESGLVGKRIVIHAGARPVKAAEVEDLLERVADGVSWMEGALATALLQRLLDSFSAAPDSRRRARHRQPEPALPGMETKPEPAPKCVAGQILPLACGLGTAVLGEPAKAAQLFPVPENDSDRVDHSIWAWPLSGIEPFDAPLPARGAQGFWEWRS